MQLFSLVMMTIGSVGIMASVILEIKTKEKIYFLLMKIFPWVFGVGAILFSLVR